MPPVSAPPRRLAPATGRTAGRSPDRAPSPVNSPTVRVVPGTVRSTSANARPLPRSRSLRAPSHPTAGTDSLFPFPSRFPFLRSRRPRSPCCPWLPQTLLARYAPRRAMGVRLSTSPSCAQLPAHRCPWGRVDLSSVGPSVGVERTELALVSVSIRRMIGNPVLSWMAERSAPSTIPGSHRTVCICGSVLGLRCRPLVPPEES